MSGVKTKVLYLLTAAAALVLAVVFARWDAINGGAACYHQHLEQPSAEELGPCPVCGGEAALCTHLPVIRIDTGGQFIPGKSILDDTGRPIGYETGANGENDIAVTVETVDGEGVWHHADDAASVTARAMFRIRGNSSRAFSKSSYRIELFENGDPEDGLDLPLLGMDPGGEWVLHGPFLDKTLLRNYMWMNISAEVMGDAPDVRFCELILDGEYRGLYLLMETVDEGPGRVDLTDYRPGDPMCSYILRITSEPNPAKTLDTFSAYTSRLDPARGVELLYPATALQTEQVHNYVASDFSEAERVLYAAQMAQGDRSYSRLLDVDSFVNYYILQEFLAVNDAFSKSTYFYKDVRGKLYVGPVWDYNNVLDNFFVPMEPEGFLLDQRGWFSQLMMDRVFVERVIGRWQDLRAGVLSEERLNAYIDETVAWLGDAVDRNYAVWGWSFDASQLASYERRNQLGEDGLLSFDTINPTSFDEAVDWMREYMNERGRWLDRNIHTLLRYCQESKNASRIVD